MGLETGEFIADLVQTNPVTATDPVAEGSDHLRLIKKVVQQTFGLMNELLAFRDNDVPLRMRNIANDAYIDLIKINANDDLELGGKNIVTSGGNFTISALADNTALKMRGNDASDRAQIEFFTNDLATRTFRIDSDPTISELRSLAGLNLYAGDTTGNGIQIATDGAVSIPNFLSVQTTNIERDIVTGGSGIAIRSGGTLLLRPTANDFDWQLNPSDASTLEFLGGGVLRMELINAGGGALRVLGLSGVGTRNLSVTEDGTLIAS